VLLGAPPTGLEWHWPSGAKVKMAHLEYEKNLQDWQGSQVPLIVFDELPHFTSPIFQATDIASALDKGRVVARNDDAALARLSLHVSVIVGGDLAEPVASPTL
jgi:hypothetical protein